MDFDGLSFIASEDELRALHHTPMSRATDKVLSHIDKHCRSVIELSPFCVIATQGENGADVSPRGDPPGFVKVLDERTLLVPDRVGNNRLDSMVNLLTNPQVGMLFFVPGMGETLRINGTARVTDDQRVLEMCAVQGRAPKIGLVVRVEEAFLHCPKAFVRSGLWDTSCQIDRNILPSYAEMLMDHVNGLTSEENDRQSEVMAKRGLY
ncbi:MAG: pyridoxamine 5'-phosphate oxidase family protein [Alphaproteobacteria bacterium]|nr:pyridoxamine 5'-phosphate oxidase family protein [Alphaproteobacteria bacterium]